MARLQQPLDPNVIKPDQGREPVPAGEYAFVVMGTEIDSTKAGNGLILNVELQITQGEFAERRVWDRINIQNPSVKAQEIGLRQLSALCHATGHLQLVEDTDVLHGRSLRAKVKLVPEKDGFQAKNEIVKYILPGQVAPGVTTQAPAVNGPAATAAPPAASATEDHGPKGARPWE